MEKSNQDAMEMLESIFSAGDVYKYTVCCADKESFRITIPQDDYITEYVLSSDAINYINNNPREYGISAVRPESILIQIVILIEASFDIQTR